MTAHAVKKTKLLCNATKVCHNCIPPGRIIDRYANTTPRNQRNVLCFEDWVNDEFIAPFYKEIIRNSHNHKTMSRFRREHQYLAQTVRTHFEQQFQCGAMSYEYFGKNTNSHDTSPGILLLSDAEN